MTSLGDRFQTGSGPARIDSIAIRDTSPLYRWASFGVGKILAELDSGTCFVGAVGLGLLGLA